MSRPQEMAAESLRRARVLIVEDDPLIAENLRTALADAGFEIAGIATRVRTALNLIENVGCDAAIVDANVAGVSAAPADAALYARGLPFVVISGYTREQLQGEFSAGLFIQKPYRLSELIDGLSAILQRGAII
jgi:DNA-binding response OmpR family regulator